MNILDGKLVMLDFARNDRFEVSLFRKGLKPEHLKQLLSINFSFFFPIFKDFDVGQALFAEHCGLGTEVLGKHLVAATCADCRPIRS